MTAPSAASATPGLFAFDRTDYLLDSHTSGLGSVAVGDLDGVNGPDIVVDGYAGDANAGVINVLLNNGDGTFAAAEQYQSCVGARDVIVAQLNPSTDSHLDVGILCDGQSIGRMLGDGAGALGDVQTVDVGYLGAAAGTGAWAASVEMLRFGHLDGPTLVYGGYVAGLAMVLCYLDVTHLEGDLDFGTPSLPHCYVYEDPNDNNNVHYEMGLSSDLVVGPFKPGFDAAVSIGFQEAVSPTIGMSSFVYGETPGTHTGFTSGWRNSGGATSAVGLDDLDGDGQNDIIMGGGLATSTITDFVPGFPIAEGASPTHSFSSVPYLYDMATGDFDGDGNIDIAAMGDDGDGSDDDVTVGIHHGNGDGTFAAYEGFRTRGYTTGGAASYQQVIAVADFNRDGLPDIATVGELDKYATVLLDADTPVVPPPTLPATYNGSSTLASRKTLALDHFLLSADARTLFGLRADGDLVLVVNDVLVWESATAGQGVTGALMNKSGALQLLGAGGTVVWSSSPIKKGASLKVLDGRAVVSLGSKVQWTRGSPIPSLVAKGTDRLSVGGTVKLNRYLRSKSKECVAAVIAGELVLWSAGGRVLFRSATAGSAATQLKLQTSGDLQLLTAGKAVVWATGTVGKSAKLVVAPTGVCGLVLATKTATLFQEP